MDKMFPIISAELLLVYKACFFFLNVSVFSWTFHCGLELGNSVVPQLSLAFPKTMVYQENNIISVLLFQQMHDLFFTLYFKFRSQYC